MSIFIVKTGNYNRCNMGTIDMKKGEDNRRTPRPFTGNGAVPLYLQLKNELKKRILSLAEQEKLPGTLELAAEYGVSKGTVNRALKLLVDENLICRIPHRGTLRCSTLDYSDPQLNSRVFGLVFPAGGYASWQEMLPPMQQNAEQAGFSLEVYLYSNAPGNLETILKRARKQCAGVVLYLSTDNDNPVKDLIEDNYPVVIIGQKFEGIPVSCVTADNYTAARRITKYFFEKGLLSVAVVFGFFKEAAYTRSRLEGWIEAHKAAGLPVDMKKVFYPEDENFTGFRQFLEENSPQALILSNNGNDWRTVINLMRRIKYPAVRLATFVLPNSEDKSCFEDDAVFAELPVAETGETAIRFLVMMLQKSVKTFQKCEIGIDIYLKRDKHIKI